MNQPDALASEAVAPITSGMTVGLGTGRAASRAVRALAARVERERLSLTCVSTSDATTALAKSLGLKVVEFAGVERVDYLFDGADEVDDRLRMIKGRGGAMTREKIVARAAKRRVYLIDDSKRVSRLGEKAPLPIEVLPFGLASVRATLARAGLKGDVRRADGGGDYRTDNGCLVIDASMPASLTPEAIDALLAATAGVIGHGLFLVEADEALVESASGALQRMRR